VVYGGDVACRHDWTDRRWYTEQGAGKSCVAAFTGPGEENAQRVKEARWRNDSVCSRCGAWCGSLGLEVTPQEYVAHLVLIFREVWRVLKPDGVLWLNLGDTYAGGGNNRGANSPISGKQASNKGATGQVGEFYRCRKSYRCTVAPVVPAVRPAIVGLPAKNLVGIPWRVAFALQQSGWILRQDIIWHKPNPMTDSVKDRCTKAHEYVFMFAKSGRYFYDAKAIQEPLKRRSSGNRRRKIDASGRLATHLGSSVPWVADGTGKNRRSVWTITRKGTSAVRHYATMPLELAELCVLSGSRVGDVVLDPFAGAATTGLAALRHSRLFTGIELSAEYCQAATTRLVLSQGRFTFGRSTK